MLNLLRHFVEKNLHSGAQCALLFVGKSVYCRQQLQVVFQRIGGIGMHNFSYGTKGKTLINVLVYCILIFVFIFILFHFNLLPLCLSPRRNTKKN